MLIADHPKMAERSASQFLISLDHEEKYQRPTKRYASFGSDMVLIHWKDEKGRLNFDLTSNVVAKNFILAPTGIMFQTRQLERNWDETD